MPSEARWSNGHCTAKVGEEIAAVVVLKEVREINERALQVFVATRAADYKVPKKILFMDEIPRARPAS